ncbi:PDZ domain-containing protein [Paraburkholderia tropica]|nr:PDZ domain-containing protein [Paraburkholderia tropica]
MLRLFPLSAARSAAAAALACAGVCCGGAHAATPSASSATVQSASSSSTSSASAKKSASKAVAKANAAQAQALAPAAGLNDGSAAASGSASDFATFVDRYGPAVVHVSARAADDQTAPPEQEAIDSDDPFSAFFRRNQRTRASTASAQMSQTGQTSPAGAPRVMTGAGSGFIVSPDGLILTTAHVVDNAGDVVVHLTDHRAFKAEVVAVDTQSDVAILQIDAQDLPFVKLGDSSKVRVGEPVLTIGSPDSFQNTVTTGIVSATSRTLADGRSFPFFQTEVPVNPDNSGGPLFNRAGEVIGIAVQVYGDGERYSSLTFAIPIEAANSFRAQLAQAGRGTKGAANAKDGDAADAVDAVDDAAPAKPRTSSTFGMHVEDVSPGLAAALGLTRAGGALVDSVAPGSAAAAAGLRAGDVIVKVGNAAVPQSSALAGQLAALPPATPTSIRLIRGRHAMTASFANAAADANSDDADDTDTDSDAGAAANMGASAGKNAGAAAGTAVGTAAGTAAGAAATLAGGAALTDSVAANPVRKAGADNVASAGPGASIVPVAMPVTHAAPIGETGGAARSANGNGSGTGAKSGGRAVADRLGLTTHALSEAEKRSSDLPLGLMVDAASGPAAHAGIQAGDIVLSLDDTLVETQQQAATLEAVAGKSVAVLIQRDSARSFVTVKLR